MYTNIDDECVLSPNKSLVEVGGNVGGWQMRIYLKEAACLMYVSAVRYIENADTTANSTIFWNKN